MRADSMSSASSRPAASSARSAIVDGTAGGVGVADPPVVVGDDIEMRVSEARGSSSPRCSRSSLRPWTGAAFTLALADVVQVAAGDLGVRHRAGDNARGARGRPSPSPGCRRPPSCTRRRWRSSCCHRRPTGTCARGTPSGRRPGPLLLGLVDDRQQAADGAVGPGRPGFQARAARLVEAQGDPGATCRLVQGRRASGSRSVPLWAFSWARSASRTASAALRSFSPTSASGSSRPWARSRGQAPRGTRAPPLLARDPPYSRFHALARASPALPVSCASWQITTNIA